jgi:hypothetical protein
MVVMLTVVVHIQYRAYLIPCRNSIYVTVKYELYNLYKIYACGYTLETNCKGIPEI